MSGADEPQVIASGPLAGAEVDPNHARRLRRAARIAAGAIFVLGATALAIWRLGVLHLVPPSFGWNRMRPDTGLAFVLAGVALAAAAGPSTARRRRLVLATAPLVALLGAAAGLARLTGVGFGLEGLMARAVDESVRALDLRMRPETSLAFVLLGVALALVGADGQRPLRLAFAQLAAAVAGAVGLVYVFAYAYGVPALLDAGARAPVSLETACGLVVAALGLVVALPDNGLGALLAARGPGGETARRLFPIGLLLPPALGLVRLRVTAAGHLSTSHASAWTAFVLAGASVVLVIWTAHRLTVGEARRRRAETDLRALLERSPVGICRSTVDGRYLSANPSFVALLGYDSEAELLALDIPSTLYASAEVRRHAVAAFREHGAAGIEVEMIRRDGQPVLVRMRGREVGGEAGETVYEVFAEDVSLRRSLELQVERSQRLESVGRLAAGVAHDFNNVAGVARGYGELLAGQLAADSKHQRWAQEIVHAIDRAAGLTRQLLALGSQQMTRPQALDLGEVLGATNGLLRRLIGDQVVLDLRVAPGIGRVRADRAQMEQVILNLAINARDAMPDGGRLILAVHDVEVDAIHAESRPGLAPGSYVQLEVTDEGCGMDSTTLAHAFEPFFTTKAPGKGTGLGLATVYGIVRQSGGAVTVYSEVGEGTTVRVYLPRLPGDPATAGAPPPAEPATIDANVTGDGQAVLVVEDEEPLRRLLTLLLRKVGFEVFEAEGPAAARSLAETLGSRLRLLVSDVQLGGGALGPDLADELRAAAPGLPVLFVSGYAAPAAIEARGARANEAFLAKPFSSSDLTRLVAALLRERRAGELTGT